MIKGFQHKGPQAFFETGSKVGNQPHHASRLQRQLIRLDIEMPEDVNVPGWRLHPLAGHLAGHYSITLNGNWRLAFRFEDGEAVLVDYQDYR